MKRIVIINQDSGYLMIDIANAFVEAGYEVSLVAGRIVERSTPLHHSVIINKIARYRRSNILLKTLTWFIAILQIISIIWIKYPDCYLFIVSNPPFAPLIPLVCKRPYSLLIYDFYVDKPGEFPFLYSKSIIVKGWKKAHTRVFSRAVKLFTLTEGMRRNIENYSGGRKCEVVPLWSDNGFLKPVPSDENPFIAKYNLHGKFIVLYSGNIGQSSGVEILVEVASMIKSECIRFLIIGDGIRKAVIEKRIKELDLNNCMILPWQDVQVLPYSLASANLAIVTLSETNSSSAIPSKLFSYMSVGAPVLGLANTDSDLSFIIKDLDIGRCLHPSSKNDIVEYILWLCSSPAECERLRQKSLAASTSFTKKNASKLIAGIQ